MCYFFTGGTGICDAEGECVNYIYPILDWDGHPGWASLTVFLGIVAIPILQLAWFGLYKLRLKIASKILSDDY